MGFMNTVGLVLFMALGILLIWLLLYHVFNLPFWQTTRNQLLNTSTCINDYNSLLGNVGSIIYCRLFANIEMLIYVLISLGFLFGVWMAIRRMMLGYEEPF